MEISEEQKEQINELFIKAFMYMKECRNKRLKEVAQSEQRAS